MSAAARKAVSQQLTAYWQKRRGGKSQEGDGTKVATGKRKATTEAKEQP